MKKIFNWIALSVVLTSAVSCKKFLDVNTNPNATPVGPAELVLPQAITQSAVLVNGLNSSYADIGGFTANIYGVGGYGTVVTYAYTTASFNVMTGIYDNAQDYQYVIDNTASDPSQIFSTSIAKIMKAVMFSKLVDQMNDVPYFNALQGSGNLTPKYDNAVLIYEDLIKQLNDGIAAMGTALAANAATAGTVPFPNEKADPMFSKGLAKTAAQQTAQFVNWRKFANTFKLKLLIKLAFSGKSATFSAAQLAAFDTTLGVITDDATVNPGYIKEAGKQAPIYTSWGYSVTGARAQSQRVPTRWITAFYNGKKITDPGRGSLIFRSTADANTNQLGNESTVTTQVPPTSPISSSSFYTGTVVAGDAKGFVKGATQSQVFMLLSEANFLLAEAYERGYLAGGTSAASAQFALGIQNSIRYLNKTPAATDDVAPTAAAVTALYNTYVSANAGNRFVIYSVNTTTPGKLEAIGTQKYLALAYINCDEAFNEFKRTEYPVIVNGSANEIDTFASTQSVSTHPDRLPTRFPYPSGEYATNAGNVPTVNPFVDRIFWDLN